MSTVYIVTITILCFVIVVLAVGCSTNWFQFNSEKYTDTILVDLSANYRENATINFLTGSGDIQSCELRKGPDVVNTSTPCHGGTFNYEYRLLLGEETEFYSLVLGTYEYVIEINWRSGFARVSLDARPHPIRVMCQMNSPERPVDKSCGDINGRTVSGYFWRQQPGPYSYPTQLEIGEKCRVSLKFD